MLEIMVDRAADLELGGARESEERQEGDIVSLQDVLQENQDLEDTANAVLGDSDDSKCSYPKVNYAIWAL